MARAKTLRRMLSIQRVLMKYGLDEFVKETHLLRPLRFFFLALPRRRDTTAPLGERIRLALEELGPIFVKFGQAISTRRDLLPPDIADELAKLQDMVPPFPAEEAIAILNEAYGQPVEEVFQRFDREPFAAASIAQVHTAQLRDGTEVVVKLLRPGVQLGHALCARDLLGLLPARSDGAGAHLRHPDQRYGCVEGIRRQYPGPGRERRGDLLHPGLPAQLLPRRHAPGQHLRQS